MPESFSTGASGPAGIGHASTVKQVFRVIGHGLWMLIPVASLGVLAWLPAAQAWWRARTAGWLLAAALLAVGSAAVLIGAADGGGGAGWGAIIIGTVLGGVVAAAIGYRTAFGQRERPLDPALREALHNRARRAEARAIAARDPELALELGVGRPDRPGGGYVDGGLIDLNNATAAGIVHVLGWNPQLAESYVAERDARHGYRSLTEIGALSSLDPAVLESSAERIIVLPYRPTSH
ncbi:helix-hairpin-helix domain-containing protein [Phytoactinopolyspora limicola]|uniref:helix-hairpin-helix domain-containing protein n=1 Tax=Phytoactinopolyspora limicola TaxID=2715536 RepID=UPI00140C7693|nr:helix-hairpin-helix domain-containing protein [Phytoactinopolyspora limicola]